MRSIIRLDEDRVSVADYTIKVRNYPSPGEGVNTAEDIKKFFEENGVKGKTCKVAKVNLVYDMTEYNKWNREKDKLLS